MKSQILYISKSLEIFQNNIIKKTSEKALQPHVFQSLKNIQNEYKIDNDNSQFIRNNYTIQNNEIKNYNNSVKIENVAKDENVFNQGKAGQKVLVKYPRDQETKVGDDNEINEHHQVNRMKKNERERDRKKINNKQRIINVVSNSNPIKEENLSIDRSIPQNIHQKESPPYTKRQKNHSNSKSPKKNKSQNLLRVLTTERQEDNTKLKKEKSLRKKEVILFSSKMKQNKSQKKGINIEKKFIPAYLANVESKVKPEIDKLRNNSKLLLKKKKLNESNGYPQHIIIRDSNSNENIALNYSSQTKESRCVEISPKDYGHFDDSNKNANSNVVYKNATENSLNSNDFNLNNDPVKNYDVDHQMITGKKYNYSLSMPENKIPDRPQHTYKTIIENEGESPSTEQFHKIEPSQIDVY